MQTLSNGYLKPSNTDTGDIFFPAMEFNIQRLNDHTHDGSNSSHLATTSQNILAASWAAAPIGGGLYVQTVTIPTGFSYDSVEVWFRLSTGEFVYPSIEKVDATHYKIYTNDNSLAYVAYYR
jgi:hypothetical protein